jgi:hypothetical protein
VGAFTATSYSGLPQATTTLKGILSLTDVANIVGDGLSFWSTTNPFTYLGGDGTKIYTDKNVSCAFISVHGDASITGNVTAENASVFGKYRCEGAFMGIPSNAGLYGGVGDRLVVQPAAFLPSLTYDYPYSIGYQQNAMWLSVPEEGYLRTYVGGAVCSDSYFIPGGDPLVHAYGYGGVETRFYGRIKPDSMFTEGDVTVYGRVFAADLACGTLFINDPIDIWTSADIGNITMKVDLAYMDTTAYTNQFDFTFENPAGAFHFVTRAKYLVDQTTLAPPSLTVAGNGYVGIRNLAPTCALDVKGNVKMYNVTTQNVTAINFSLFSDERMKSNIRNFKESKNFPSSTMADTLCKLDAKVYNAVDEDGKVSEKDSIGLIAQQVKTIFPEMIAEREDGMLGISYMSFVPVLIESIKELTSRISALEDIVSSQKKPRKT